MSAPARLIAVRCSRATASWSIQPLAAAALIIEYSPLTWYAASGTSTASRTAADHVEVGQRRLDHHHVGALGDVGVDLDQRLAGVAPVLLVALAVATAGDRARRPRRGTGRTGRWRTWPSSRGSPRAAKPAASSAARIAPTWPSIIPLGATTCGAGRRLGDGGLGVDLERGVVVDVAVGVDDAAVAVARCTRRRTGRPSARRRRRPRRAGRRAPAARCPSGSNAPEPTSSLIGRDAEQHHRLDAHRRPARRPPCGGSRGCPGTTPGSDAISIGASMPSRTNSGAIRSVTATLVSATRSRSAGVRRSRRGRWIGKSAESPGTAMPAWYVHARFAGHHVDTATRHRSVPRWTPGHDRGQRRGSVSRPCRSRCGSRRTRSASARASRRRSRCRSRTSATAPRRTRSSPPA